MSKTVYLTTKEASERLGVHTNTLRRWMDKGKLPYTKIGREYRIPEDAIVNKVSSVKDGCRIIAIANQKGGVAKTTSTLNIAAALALNRKRVLIVDLDPQGGCGVSIGIATDSLKKTIYNVLMESGTHISDIIMSTNHGFDIAPSNIDLAAAEFQLKQLLAAEHILKEALEEVIDDYDYILMDCPPSLGMLTINAFTAADELMIPMSMEFLALRGLEMLAKTIKEIKERTNRDLTYLGILATKYDRRTLNSKEIFEALEETAKNTGIRLFKSYIVNSIRFAESPNTKTPLVLDDPTHEGAKAYMQVAQEIINA